MKSSAKGIIRAIFVLVLAILLLSQLALSSFAWRLFEDTMLPEMDRKAATIGLSVQKRLFSAFALGIPFSRLEGVEEFFAATRKNNPDLAFLALSDQDGKLVHLDGIAPATAKRLLPSAFSAESTQRSVEADGTAFNVSSFPLVADGENLGTLHVAVSQSFIAARIAEIRLDILTVVLASLLVAFELLVFIVSISLQQPLRHVWTMLQKLAEGDFRELASVRARELSSLAERANSLALAVNERAAGVLQHAARFRSERVDAHVKELCRRFAFASDGRPVFKRRTQVMQVRILTFLFMFAEQLSRPFLPLLVKDILPAWSDGAGRDLLIGMPITAFMIVVAFGMPLAGRWIERAGCVRAFLAGAFAMLFGLFGAAFALSIYDFTLWRMLTAAGYATMFMACQAFVLDGTDETDRARGISLFVGAIMMAEICAPAIGGILADRLGYSVVFIFGAVVAALAAFLGQKILREHVNERAVAPAGSGLATMLRSLASVRFLILLLFAAIPAKLMLTGILFYLVPVVLAEMSVSQADIGRIVMAYGVPGLLLMPFFSSLADRLRCHGLMVGLGGIITGAALLPVLFDANRSLVIIGVAGLGIGQAMSIASQLALVTEVCRDKIAASGKMAVLGPYRFMERIGAALGPLVAGGLSAAFGPLEAMAVMGVGCLICAVIFSAAFLVLGLYPDEDAAAADAPLAGDAA